MKTKNDAFLIVRIPQELKDKLNKKADKSDKTLSKLIREILDKASYS